MHNLIFLLTFISFFTVDTRQVKFVEPINIGGEHLFSVRGNEASKRADVIYSRLRNVLSPKLQPSDIVVSMIKGQVIISVNDEILLTITTEDAQLNKSDRVSLANKIQKKLCNLLPSLVPLEPKITHN